MSVHIIPIPSAYLKITRLYRPGHPPIFDGDPTPEDIALARALFLELDSESQDWYGRRGVFAGL